MITHPFELWLIQFIHTFRTPLSDSFFIACHFFDTIYFFLLLIPALWLVGHRLIAYKMVLIFLLSLALNQLLKGFFGLPRPYHLDPTLTMVTVSSHGFPSGAAQSAVLLCGILLKEWRSHWRWLVGPLFASLLCFSRIYLGLHFPSDILGGLVSGGFLLWIYQQMGSRRECETEGVDA